MAIIKILSCDEFVQAFDDYNRGNNFSIAARRHLYDYFQDYSEGTDQDYTLDVIAICCEWAEYTQDELMLDYGYMLEDDDDVQALIDELERNTTVLEVEHFGKESTYLVVAF